MRRRQKTADVEEARMQATDMDLSSKTKYTRKKKTMKDSAVNDRVNSSYFKPSDEKSNSRKRPSSTRESFASKVKSLKLSDADSGSDFECNVEKQSLALSSNMKMLKGNQGTKGRKEPSKLKNGLTEVKRGDVKSEKEHVSENTESVTGKKTSRKTETVVIKNEKSKGKSTGLKHKTKTSKKSLDAEQSAVQEKANKKRKTDNSHVPVKQEATKEKSTSGRKAKNNKKCNIDKKNVNDTDKKKSADKDISYNKEKFVVPEVKEESSSDDDFEEVDCEPECSRVETGKLCSGQNISNNADFTSKCSVDREGSILTPTTSGQSTSKQNTKGSKLPKTLDHNDAMAVLLHMEGASQSGSQQMSTHPDRLSDSEEDSESEGEWEDVEDHVRHSPKKSQIPSGSVEITLEAPVLYKKKKKRGFDLQAYFRRQVNKFKKGVAMDVHRVHLLCLVARCQYLNKACLDETVKAQALSLAMVTKELKLPSAKAVNEQHIIRVLRWINTNREHLEDAFKQSLHDVSSHIQLVLICVVLLREVGVLTRLVMSLQPLSFKQTSSKGKSSSKKGANSLNVKKKSAKPSSSKQQSKPKVESAEKTSVSKIEKKKQSNIKGAKRKLDTAEESKTGQRRQSGDRKCRKRGKSVYKENSDDENDVDPGDDEDDDDYAPEDDIEDTGTQKKKGSDRRKHGVRKMKMEKSDTSESQTSSDSDFEEQSILIRTQQLKKQRPSPRNKKILSEDEEEGRDCWVEVYLETEKSWLCIDGASLEIKKPYELENTASQPVHYVIGITAEGYIKDITARYASQWLTETRKLRTDQNWWEETLEPYKCPDTGNDELENRDMANSLQKQPLPTSIGAFKNHPLYVLRRHLLKFEALYPDTAIPVGYIRGEPVYARECVHTLHSRENWLKEGRAVRVGEEAYKFVKSRPKWNKPKDDPEAKDLELFGHWQTEPYIPPPAVDGKVPRNAHGNVEMFLPSMLPAGTAHLKIPGLNKVAKKLNIDCAPAMVGWDHHCGFSHPLMDGWIVCEEHKDILLAAWDEEQEIIREKEAQKREKRVYDNWRKLIRGMLIKERLKKRFDLEEVKPSVDEESQPAPSTSKDVPRAGEGAQGDDGMEGETTLEKARDVEFSWPQNRITKPSHMLCEVEKL